MRRRSPARLPPSPWQHHFWLYLRGASRDARPGYPARRGGQRSTATTPQGSSPGHSHRETRAACHSVPSAKTIVAFAELLSSKGHIRVQDASLTGGLGFHTGRPPGNAKLPSLNTLAFWAASRWGSSGGGWSRFCETPRQVWRMHSLSGRGGVPLLKASSRVDQCRPLCRRE